MKDRAAMTGPMTARLLNSVTDLGTMENMLNSLRRPDTPKTSFRKGPTIVLSQSMGGKPNPNIGGDNDGPLVA